MKKNRIILDLEYSYSIKRFLDIKECRYWHIITVFDLNELLEAIDNSYIDYSKYSYDEFCDYWHTIQAYSLYDTNLSANENRLNEIEIKDFNKLEYVLFFYNERDFINN